MVNWKSKYLKYKLKFEKLNSKQKAGTESLSPESTLNLQEFIDLYKNDFYVKQSFNNDCVPTILVMILLIFWIYKDPTHKQDIISSYQDFYNEVSGEIFKIDSNFKPGDDNISGTICPNFKIVDIINYFTNNELDIQYLDNQKLDDIIRYIDENYIILFKENYQHLVLIYKYEIDEEYNYVFKKIDPKNKFYRTIITNYNLSNDNKGDIKHLNDIIILKFK